MVQKSQLHRAVHIFIMRNHHTVWWTLHWSLRQGDTKKAIQGLPEKNPLVPVTLILIDGLPKLSSMLSHLLKRPAGMSSMTKGTVGKIATLYYKTLIRPLTTDAVSLPACIALALSVTNMSSVSVNHPHFNHLSKS